MAILWQEQNISELIYVPIIILWERLPKTLITYVKHVLKSWKFPPPYIWECECITHMGESKFYGFDIKWKQYNY